MKKLPYTKFNHTPYETHMLAYDLIKPNSQVLDVGCAYGYFSEELQKKNCSMWGIEINEDAARYAKRFCKDVYLIDLEKADSIPTKSKFDHIILLDVIEHIRNAEHLIGVLKKYLKNDGTLILSTPNIAFIKIRHELALGRFDYTETGILDKTHVKLYTKKSLLVFLKSQGLIVNNITYTSNFVRFPLIGKYLNYIPKRFQHSVTQQLGGLLGYQFVVACSRS